MLQKFILFKNRVFGGPFNAPFSGVNGGTWAGPMRDIKYFKYDYLLIYYFIITHNNFSKIKFLRLGPLVEYISNQ